MACEIWRDMGMTWVFKCFLNSGGCFLAAPELSQSNPTLVHRNQDLVEGSWPHWGDCSKPDPKGSMKTEISPCSAGIGQEITAGKCPGHRGALQCHGAVSGNKKGKGDFSSPIPCSHPGSKGSTDPTLLPRIQSWHCRLSPGSPGCWNCCGITDLWPLGSLPSDNNNNNNNDGNEAWNIVSFSLKSFFGGNNAEGIFPAVECARDIDCSIISRIPTMLSGFKDSVLVYYLVVLII